jgi:hypothetical protein
MVNYDPGVYSHDPNSQRAPSASGLGLTWGGAWGLGKHYPTAGAQSQGYGRAAQTLLQGGELADKAMFDAYRDMYRARLGGAAAGQQEFVTGMAGEADATGLSPDVVRRLVISRQAEQTQQLGAVEGELQADYGMKKAELVQGTGAALANLQLDETKWGTEFDRNIAAQKKARDAALLSAGIGAIGAVGAGWAGGGFSGGSEEWVSGQGIW